MERLLIVGVGDVARRALPALVARFDSLALLRPGAAAVPGARIATGDLDRPETLAPLAGAAELVLHLAPPDETRDGDARTRNLIAALSGARMLPRRFVYISTSGVYGDCGGERIDESRPVNPATPRAARRVDSERAVTEWGAAAGVETVILRVPGIYAADRLPVERLKRGTPVLRPEDDVYTNHVHAEDLAAICVRALEADAPAGIYNASDDSELKMGEWFDLVADRFGLPRPPRVSRAEAARTISPMLLSFMSESRRLVNRRLKDVLGVRLKYPTVFDGVPHGTGAVAGAEACG
jgi:nucleoside-diphosphate-sugar epimerase